MFKKITYTTSLIIFTLFLNSCEEYKHKDTSEKGDMEKVLTTSSNTPSKEEVNSKLTIYHNVEIEPQNCKFKIKQDTTLYVTEDMKIQNKAELIAKTISNKYFTDLRIKVSIVNTVSEKLCLNVNLIENDDFGDTLIPSWNQNFSASCSSNWTQSILDANFYQKEYKGKWIDTVQYYYEGELNGIDELF